MQFFLQLISLFLVLGINAIQADMQYLDQFLNRALYPLAYSHTPVASPDIGAYVSGYKQFRVPNPVDKNDIILDWIPFDAKSETPRRTILFFHGNGGYSAHSIFFLAKVQKLLKANIVMMEYRGYNKAPGTPNRPNILTDAETSLDWIRQRHDTDNNDILIYGHSLGGAVASALYAARPDEINAVILECTFASIKAFLPGSGIGDYAPFIDKLVDNWDSAAAWTSVAKKGKIPKVLMLGGRHDHGIPVRNLKTLLKIVSETPEKVTFDSPELFLQSANPAKTKTSLIVFPHLGHLVQDHHLMNQILSEFLPEQPKADTATVRSVERNESRNYTRIADLVKTSGTNQASASVALSKSNESLSATSSQSMLLVIAIAVVYYVADYLS